MAMYEYRGLSQVTLNYQCPLLLAPTALEQLQEAKVFNKLNLWSTYNLEHIHEGDEWKMAFSTTSGLFQ